MEKKYTGIYENNRYILKSRRHAKHAAKRKLTLFRCCSIILLSVVLGSTVGFASVGTYNAASEHVAAAVVVYDDSIDNTAIIPSTSKDAKAESAIKLEGAVSTTEDSNISSTVDAFYVSETNPHMVYLSNGTESHTNATNAKVTTTSKTSDTVHEEQPAAIETDEQDVPDIEDIKEDISISKTKVTSNEINSTAACAENSGYEHYLEDPGYADIEGYVFEPEYNADGSVNYFGWTYEDFDYLSQCIAGEAGNCSWKWQMYVGSVVLNRVHHTAFSQNTIKGICLAPYQYSCFDKSVGRVTYTTVSEKNKAVAYELLKNGSVLPYNVVFQAEFTQGVGTYEHIGNTYFCYINY